MSEPMFTPDALDEASAHFWAHARTYDVMADIKPFQEDESFAITDISDAEWSEFIRALRE